MNNRPLYENLDTAFVNLSALVKYLRQRKFVGRIRIELNNYEGDIFLYAGNKLNAREYDKISGRVSEGEEAFQILLIRTREPGCSIHVYHAEPAQVETPAVAPAPIKAQAKAANGNSAPVTKTAAAVKPAGPPAQNDAEAKVVKIAELPKKPAAVKKQPEFPFELHSTVEEKARRTRISGGDWQVLLGLTGELLGTIDKSLAAANLDFKSAFSKARSEISADYPFLHPSGNIFDYLNGRITMQEQVNAKLFVTGLLESLRRILDKLGAAAKFAEVYRRTAQQILALINQRKPFYDKFSLTLPLKKILGV
jgi:hypothetical protein